MKIELSKKEYRDLLDLLAISDWVLNANAAGGEREETSKYKEVEQKILSFAKEYHFENLVEYDDDSKEYRHSKAYEDDEYMRFVDEYSEDVFWNELSDQLSSRDFIEEVGEEKYSEMEPGQRLVKLSRLAEKYDDEFEKNGIKNVKLKL